MQTLGKACLLLFAGVFLCCVVYPISLWAAGQLLFPFQANGSILSAPDGNAVGSKLIAQPFTKDEYFHPRPSAASYDASASASSTLAPSNYALRDRVARSLAPLARYRNGRPVAPDIETWFAADRYQDTPHIVSQWATLHPALAQTWFKSDPARAAHHEQWSHSHLEKIPVAVDPAVAFFQDFSLQHPAQFPTIKPEEDQPTHTSLQTITTGPEIQSTFFDMWRQDHPDVDLESVPADFVTASASGLDPHITLDSARLQLDRVATRWAAHLHRDPKSVHNDIEALLRRNAFAPFNGLAGELLVNVLELNLTLRQSYGAPP